jgi:hypothetical protein
MFNNRAVSFEPENKREGTRLNLNHGSASGTAIGLVADGARI